MTSRWFDQFAVIWVILTSGSMFFNICNMMLSMIILLAIAFAYILQKRTISIKNLQICVLLCGFIAASTIYNGLDSLVLNDLIIIMIRLFSLLVIMSNVDEDCFRETFINTIFVIAAVSLPCFVINLLVPEVTLPFTYSDAENNFFGTFYYTLGSVVKGVFIRNCGIFWEPGLFQIYLNFALGLLVVSKDLKINRATIKFIVMSIALVTTLSTMGYFCFAIVIMILLANATNKANKIYLYVAGVALIFLFIVESSTHIIEGKLIDKDMSYGSRYDDTLISFTIAMDNTLFGVGPVSDHVTIYKEYMVSMNAMRESVGILARSNGLGNFSMKFGIPVTIIYLFLVYKRLRYITSFFNSILLLVMLICCFCNEPIMFTTIWLSFFMRWRTASINNNIQVGSIPIIQELRIKRYKKEI
jgi:hypothetical protein